MQLYRMAFIIAVLVPLVAQPLSQTEWSTLYKRTEQLIMTDGDLVQAKSNLKQLEKDAFKLGGVTYIKKLNRLKNTFAIQKNIAQGDFHQAEQIAKFANRSDWSWAKKRLQEAKNRKNTPVQPVQPAQPTQLVQPAQSVQPSKKPSVTETEQPPVMAQPVVNVSQQESTRVKPVEESKSVEPKTEQPPVPVDPNKQADRQAYMEELVQELCDLGEEMRGKLEEETTQATNQEMKELHEFAAVCYENIEKQANITSKNYPALAPFVQDIRKKAQDCLDAVKRAHDEYKASLASEPKSNK